MAKMKTKSSESRRAFIRKAAYVAPVILTLSAAPSFSKAGSRKGPEPDHKPLQR